MIDIQMKAGQAAQKEAKTIILADQEQPMSALGLDWELQLLAESMLMSSIQKTTVPHLGLI